MSAQERVALFLFGYLLSSWTGAEPIQIPVSVISVTSHGTQYYNWTADRVNDGSLRQDSNACQCCTSLQRPSWVQLSLNKTYIVERVLVLGRTEYAGEHFEHISLSIGRRTESLQDEQFTSKTTTNAEMRLTPPREIQFVRVTGSGTRMHNMVICEILIYRQADCPIGRYSVNCSEQCRCMAGPCDSVTGTCGNGVCKDGWRGKVCNETCKPGTFGAYCSSTCHCHNNETCNHTDGSCPNDQCAAGWTHDNCSVACGQGMFGLNCYSSCKCLHGASCDHVSGNCSNNQCSPGWTTSNCSIACKPGYYGHNCSMDCHCDTCHHINGSCAMSFQCHDGYRMDNGFCKQTHTAGSSFAAIVALSISCGLLLVTNVVTICILVYFRRKERMTTSATPAQADTGNQYDTLSSAERASANYEGLQMTQIEVSDDSESTYVNDSVVESKDALH